MNKSIFGGILGLKGTAHKNLTGHLRFGNKLTPTWACSSCGLRCKATATSCMRCGLTFEEANAGEKETR